MATREPLARALERARLRRRLPDAAVRRLLRERAGVRQVELAQALGVSSAAVSRWETGIRTPRAGVLALYIEVLDRLAREVANGGGGA